SLSPPWKSENTSADCFDVFLGNRRLSIIDLSSNGHQPMTDHNGRWIVYNGEIFNYLELRRDLQAKGHEFATGTDTEVILHIYSEYGEQGFDRLNGMWAFAIADVPRRRVILSRDRFSIKPLYVLRVHHCIYFASEIKQLLPLLPERRLNAEIMSTFLAQGLLDHSRETFFDGIVRASSCTNIVISLDTGDVHESAYWRFHPVSGIGSSQAAAEQFRELFLDSIKIRLRSDVKVGVLLSGGLDSSAIAVGCTRTNGDDVETYSIVSEDGVCDEHQFIEMLTKTGLRNNKIVFRCADVVQDTNTVLEHSDEPVGGFSVMAQFKLFSVIKQHTDVTVLLSGQGGDEVLLGYLKFFFFHLKSLYRQHKYSQALFQLLASLWQRTVVSQFTLRSARRYIQAFDPGLSRAIKPEYTRVPVWDCGDVPSRQIADIEKYSVPALTHYEDRNSMAHSLEVRHPFLDHRLVELLVSLPPEWKIKNGWTKHVLRRAITELPDAIRWRRDKQGFLTPEQQWLRYDLRDLIRTTFRNSQLAQAGILNDREFLNYYEQFQRGAAIDASDIARVFIAERWMQRTFGQPAHPHMPMVRQDNRDVTVKT
ncbi:MAG: asparagine synthase (glutamine-hydrolyzing), partial [Acidobacteriaceae bacterium]|nr:asparagine synthase (glutamine-hydrolyzing) [Acidobacteriaceae bacterium]